MKMCKKNIISFCLFTVLVGFGCLLAYLRIYLNRTLADDKLIFVEKGMGLDRVVKKLKEEKIIYDKFTFKIIFKIRTKNKTNIRYGEYFFEKGITVGEVIKKIINNKVYYRTITFAEGLSNHTILKMIDNNEFLTGVIPDNIPEGSLLPETYTFQKGDTKKSLVERMQKSMIEAVDKYWESRAKDLPIRTKAEAIVLASIVEKETGIASERPLVASVFVNRLSLNMPLQSDPTAIYGYAFGDTSKEKEKKTNVLIRMDSPYNTYKIRALPPTPICNPGKQAINAVLNPAKTKYLFFVASGNGGHNFSENYRDHQKMVNSFRKVTKKRMDNNFETLPEPNK
ncbi:MAG: endolytic transglycosylase MltG [Rickettsiales bacterium]|jgi:UPF0755 protein|nr:endolytic transglycosylase MltG [Rickettsiales bacterium]